MRQADQERHDLALRTWRLETLSNLLTSQLAGQPADAERLRTDLEQTVQQQVGSRGGQAAAVVGAAVAATGSLVFQAAMMLIASNPRAMGELTVSKRTKVLGWAATAVMFAASALFLAFVIASGL